MNISEKFIRNNIKVENIKEKKTKLNNMIKNKPKNIIDFVKEHESDYLKLMQLLENKNC